MNWLLSCTKDGATYLQVIILSLALTISFYFLYIMIKDIKKMWGDFGGEDFNNEERDDVSC